MLKLGTFSEQVWGDSDERHHQDKVWATGPGGERWEVYTVLADSQTFGASPQTLIDAGQAPDAGVACCGTSADSTSETTDPSCC